MDAAGALGDAAERGLRDAAGAIGSIGTGVSWLAQAARRGARRGPGPILAPGQARIARAYAGAQARLLAAYAGGCAQRGEQHPRGPCSVPGQWRMRWAGCCRQFRR